MAHSHQGRMYLNFPGLDEEGARMLEDTFSDNYARLGGVKQRYDKDNLFSPQPEYSSRLILPDPPPTGPTTDYRRAVRCYKPDNNPATGLLYCALRQLHWFTVQRIS